MANMTTAQYLEQINAGMMAELTKHKDALPPGFNRERFALNCVTVIQDMLKDPKKRENLNGVAPASIITTLVKGAYLGLDFLNGECYAIPYKGKNGAPGTMNFQTDYKGEIKLCKKYSKNKIKDIFAKVVRKSDEFYEEVDGGVQKIYFRPRPYAATEGSEEDWVPEPLPIDMDKVTLTLWSVENLIPANEDEEE